MPELLGSPKIQYFDTSTGEFLVGGMLYTYAVDSTTPKATYPTNADATNNTNPNTNPIILDSRGEAIVWFNGTMKFVLTDSLGNQIWSEDFIGQTNNNIIDENGNALITFVSVNNAVNALTVSNAVTGQSPIIESSGTDTNVGLKITTQAGGALSLNGGSSGPVNINNISSGPINLDQATNVTGALTVTGAINQTGNLSTSGTITSFGIPVYPTLIGQVFPYLGSIVPPGCLALDGSAISRTTYSTLFALIGTTFGVGDGTTTFNLPDLRRRTVIGSGGTAVGSIGITIGSTGGEELHTMTQSELVAHTHTISQNTTSASSGGGVTVATTAGTVATGSTGSSTPFNVMQPTIVLMYAVIASYTLSPTASSLGTTTGSHTGGTSVTVTGVNFIPGATTITIGGNTVSSGSVTVNSNTSCTFTTPAHAAGVVDVTVTTTFGASTLPASFTYS